MPIPPVEVSPLLPPLMMVTPSMNTLTGLFCG